MAPIVLGLLLGMAALAPAATADELRWVDYDRGLFLRSGPGRTWAIVGGIEYGEAVELLRVQAGDWGYVRRGDGSLGYARANHLIRAQPPAKPITWHWTRHLYVTVENGLNVRSGPGTGFPVVGTLAHGEGVVDCKEAAAGWMKIRDGLGVVGYVSSNFLSLTAPALRHAPIEVGGEGTTVYRDRQLGAAAVDQVPWRTRLDVLSGDWDGFIKVRLPDTRTGYIAAAALAGGASSTDGTGWGVLAILALGFIGGLYFLAMRAASAEAPAPPRPVPVPAALFKVIPAVDVTSVPGPPEPPFLLPPLPGGATADADAAAAYAAALADDVAGRTRAKGQESGWSVTNNAVRCAACGALPFDLVRRKGDGECRCFSCAWQAGWLGSAEAFEPSADHRPV